MKYKKFNLTILGILLICLSVANNSLSGILLTNEDLYDDNETNFLKIAYIPQNGTIEYDALTDVHTEYLIGESPIHVANVSYLRLGYWNEMREIYIKFNITSIENIKSMKLRFIQGWNSALDITDYEIKLSLVDNNWTDYATDMWWDSRPAELGYSVVDTMTVGGWEHEPVEVNFDITELKDGLNDTLFSIFLEPNNLSQVANFFYQPASSENTNTSIHPKLIVEYGYSHSKIYINGNNQFTSENGVSNPSALGTEGDPFIIENWIIDAGGSGSAIFIENTNKYFKIENCSFYNSGSNVADAGMRFYNVSNGIIINNTVSNNGWSGMRLISSVNNTITNNIANNNPDLGIYLRDSSNSNNVTYNTCNNNGQWGIELYINSDGNLIKGNTVSSNNKVGIQINSGCDNNLIYYNTISGNIQNNAKDDGSSNNWDNGTIGNYWSDYGGYDINDDGLGDSAYSISGSAGSKDYYPIWDDGAETYLWTDPELISTESTDISEAPDIVIDNEGNVHVVWHDYTNDYLGSGADVDVYYKRWNATSETWTLTEVVSNESGVTSEEPKIDVDQNGNVYVVWYEHSDLGGSGSDQDVFYKIWNATTNNWTLTGVVSAESDGASNEPDIAIDNTGNVHVVWHDYTNDYLGSGSDEDIFYKRWNASSNTWTITEVVSIGSTGPSRFAEIAVDSDGNAHVTWSDLGNDYMGSGSESDIFYRRWNATSNSWTTVEVVSAGSSSQSFYPEIATDAFENVHFTWHSLGSNYNVYYRNWNATSKIWSSTTLISTEYTDNAEDPFISIDIYGNVHIVWHNDTASYEAEILYKRWNAFNDTWTNLIIVSTTGDTTDCWKAPAIASDTYGGTHIVWSDYTSGDWDIYYRKLIIDYGAPKIVINDPIDKVYFNQIPKINVSVYDPNFDQLWYRVGFTNIVLTNNTEQILESSIWNGLDQGEFIIYIYANDTRGNLNIKNVTLYKDTESPATSIVYQAVDVPNYISRITLLNLTSVDVVSGVFNISYKIDSGTWELHTNPFNLSGFSHGNHTIYYYATDNLGNVEDVKQSIIFLDILAPNISFEISPFYLNTLKPQYTQNYLQINCSVVDNTTISWVYLNENSTGTFFNRSMSLINGNYTYNIDLSPLIWNNTIAFSFHANDSASNIRHFNNEGQDFLISMDEFSRSPILIDGNNNFTSGNGVRNPTASGTKNDPYIIENWIIDGGVTGTSIDILNTDAYFIIRNCTTYNSVPGSIGSGPFYHAGIRFYNVSNAKIINNNISNSRFSGIRLYYNSDNNIIKGNIANNNPDVGIILLKDCYNNTVLNNLCNDNGQWGIQLHDNNDGNLIMGNTASFNDKVGIYLTSGSDNNFIYNNSISGNIQNNAIDDGSNNNWDNGTIGNYWGDYESNYPNALNDGFFWDTPYTIFGSANSFDNHPVDNFLEEDPFYFNFLKTQMTYSKNGVYEFNCTWSDDDNAISEVFLRFNGTIYSVSQNFSGEFSYSFYDLPANENGYEYQWLAKDQYNAWNATPINSFILYRSNILPLSLLFNGTEGDTVQYSHQDVNVTILVQTAFYGNFELYINNILVDQSFSSHLTNISRYSIIGLYNITGIIYNQNYSGSIIYWMTIEDIIAPDIIFDISPFYLNTTTPQYNQTGLQINCTVQDDTSIIWVYLCENSTGTFVNRTMLYISWNYTFNLDISSLNWSNTIVFSFYANDSAGNIKWDNNGGLNYLIKIYDYQNPSTSINFQVVESPNFASNSTLFAFNADDSGNGASGVCNISYRIDSEGWSLYINPFNLAGYSHGTHTIYYYTIDNAGNTEDIKQEIMFLDIQSPNITFDISLSYLNTTTPQYNQIGLQINCTVQDDTSIIWVYLCENSTGTFMNRTMSYVNSKYTFNLDISSLNWSNVIIFSFYANDSIGYIKWDNNGGLNYSIQIYDFQDPITIIDFNLSYNPNFIRDITLFSLLAEDNLGFGGSGVTLISYNIDDGVWNFYTNPFNLSGFDEGFHTIYYNATDYAGNIEITNQMTVYIDINNISSSIDFIYYEDSGIKYVNNFTQFILNWNDGTGSGLQNIFYKIDSEPFSVYSASFTLLGYSEGLHNITYYTIDNVGNMELEKSKTIYLDVTALDLNIFYNIIYNSNYIDENTSISITSIEDLGSGVKNVQYRIDEGTWINGTEFNLNSLTLGEHTIYYRVEDNIGNFREKSEVVFLVTNESDIDDDRLTYQEELNFSTDPFNDDTDGDKLLDGDEVNIYHTNPLSRDTDGDGFSDYEEVFIFMTDPNSFLSSPSAIIITISIIIMLINFGIWRLKTRNRRKVEKEIIEQVRSTYTKVLDDESIDKKLYRVGSKLNFQKIIEKHEVEGFYILDGSLFITNVGIREFSEIMRKVIYNICNKELSNQEDSRLIKIGARELLEFQDIIDFIKNFDF